MINFAFPVALFGALLALPIIVFYILKIRLRRMQTSTSLFWDQIYDEKPPRSIWEVLRHLLSLLAQLALLALLVLALADPYLPWQLLAARRIVLVVDPSASMQAVDVNPNRFAAAIKEAATITEGIRFRDQMAIIVAGEHPVIVCGMTNHVPTLKRTLKELRATDAPTHLAPAVTLAQRLIADHSHGEVVVLTDGATKNADELITMENVNLRIFGTPSRNVGITLFQVRRSLIDPLGYEALVAVKNASPRSVQCRLEVDLNGSPVDVIPLTLGPDEVWSKSIEKTTMEGGELDARLTQIQPVQNEASSRANQDDPEKSSNQLTCDDSTWAILPERTIQQVLLVSPSKNLFLRKVLEANPLVNLQVLTELPSQWPEDTLVVLHQTVPEVFPQGNFWVIDPLTPSDLWEFNGDLANPIITDIDQDSTLMKHVQLENVMLPKTRQLTFQNEPHVLAGSVTGEPVYAEVKRPHGKLLVLAVDLDEGDLTFRTAFPILAANALGWFADAAGELQPSLTTGPAVKIPLSMNETLKSANYSVRSPNGDVQPLPVHHSQTSWTKPSEMTASDSDTITVGPLDRVGIWTIETSDPKSPNTSPIVVTRFACNLSDESETNIRSPESMQKQQRPITRAGWFARPLWFYLIVLAVAYTSVEWALSQRRMIR